MEGFSFHGHQQAATGAHSGDNLSAVHMTYAEQLKHPLWQKKRLEILERDGFKCQRCGSAEKTLHVHHALYRKGRAPWEYEDNLLNTFCEECHELEEAYRDDLLEAFAMLPAYLRGSAVGRVQGLAFSPGPDMQKTYTIRFRDERQARAFALEVCYMHESETADLFDMIVKLNQPYDARALADAIENIQNGVYERREGKSAEKESTVTA